MKITAVFVRNEREFRSQKKEVLQKDQHYYLLYYIKKSTFTWKSTGTTSTPCTPCTQQIPKGSLLLLDADAFSADPDCFGADYMLMLTQSRTEMPLPMRLGIAAQVILTLSPDEGKETASLFSLLSDFHHKRTLTEYTDYAAHQLLEILFRRMRMLTLEKTILQKPDSNTAALVTLREWIYREPEKDWTINEMAESVRISRTHLQRIFSDTFGCSCYQDVLKSRLRLADTLLLSTNIPICKIAQKCGFDSDSTFIRAFKRFRGCTPTTFRHASQLPPETNARQDAQCG